MHSVSVGFVCAPLPAPSALCRIAWHLRLQEYRRCFELRGQRDASAAQATASLQVPAGHWRTDLHLLHETPTVMVAVFSIPVAIMPS